MAPRFPLLRVSGGDLKHEHVKSGWETEGRREIRSCSRCSPVGLGEAKCPVVGLVAPRAESRGVSPTTTRN